MMRYAESAQCRKQMLRAYFGEPEGEACGICDNCRAPLTVAEAAPGLAPQVIEVQTAAGSFQTTAPETLPHEETPRYRAGDHIYHRRFGPGKVLDCEGETILARFEKSGTKKVRAGYLRKAG
jgi:ATP-dependent DNA helicase RecQ